MLQFETPLSAAANAVLRDPALVGRYNNANLTVEVEMAGAADPQELLARLVTTGARLERFELVRPSLHRIFLEKVGAQVEVGLSGHG
jgi:ABC-type uncharacterized transport system ATPase subunit